MPGHLVRHCLPVSVLQRTKPREVFSLTSHKSPLSVIGYWSVLATSGNLELMEEATYGDSKDPSTCVRLSPGLTRATNQLGSHCRLHCTSFRSSSGISTSLTALTVSCDFQHRWKRPFKWKLLAFQFPTPTTLLNLDHNYAMISNLEVDLDVPVWWSDMNRLHQSMKRVLIAPTVCSGR